MGFQLVPMTTEAQRRYFWASVCARAGRFPFRGQQPRQMEAMVTHELAKPESEVRIIVTEEDPDAFAGCLAWRPGFIVHAFVSPELQRQGLMKWALDQAGFEMQYTDIAGTVAAKLDGLLDPTPVLVWSATATRIAAKGWRIYPAIPFQKGDTDT